MVWLVLARPEPEWGMDDHGYRRKFKLFARHFVDFFGVAFPAGTPIDVFVAFPAKEVIP